MTDLTINDQYAARLRDLAEREHRTIDELIPLLILAYESRPEAQTPEARVRTYRRKLYRRARSYWRETDNQERLALTDEQLDEQFWCLDPQGIPRLKEDQGSVSVPDNGLREIIELAAQDNPTGEVGEQIDSRL